MNRAIPVLAVAAMLVTVVAPAFAQAQDPKEDCQSSNFRIISKGKGKDRIEDTDSSTNRCIFLGRGNDVFIDEYRLKGGQTNDTADAEKVYGGPGDDKIDLRDGDYLDSGACGPGNDTIWADAHDGVIDFDDCELVERLPQL